MTEQDILKRCDHTILRPDATFSEVEENCRLAIEHSCASVCIAPTHVFASKAFCGERMKICTVVGFPNGYNDLATKTYEAQRLIEEGADEIDAVINLSYASARDYAALEKELEALRAASRGRVLKIIVECCYLPENMLPDICRMVSASGADFIKTSTGFGKYGARIEDVETMRKFCAPETKIKAAGGISTFEEARAFINAGADRLGTSKLAGILAARR